MVELDGDQTEVNITGLEEEAPFVVKMRARNQDGLGIISETYNVTTGIKCNIRILKCDPDLQGFRCNTNTKLNFIVTKVSATIQI